LCGQRLSAVGDLKETLRHAAGRLLVTRQLCGRVSMSILEAVQPFNNVRRRLQANPNYEHNVFVRYAVKPVNVNLLRWS
jgi:hypothetical protein